MGAYGGKTVEPGTSVRGRGASTCLAAAFRCIRSSLHELNAIGGYFFNLSQYQRSLVVS